MFQTRDEVRQVYVSVWQKMQLAQLLEPMESLIADIIQLHPEYHPYLEQGESIQSREFNPESGNSNPFLHMGMHIALREQVSTDRPVGIKSIHHKLSNKLGQHPAEHAMIECLGQALWLAQRNNTMPDDNSYLLCLKRL
ncbi:MAG: DUF1841 family protein [Gammaproteobacteria bacterium]|nr:DUF1841 family protein [Gammaproteobacteria bacterium]MBL6999250.1 DUF1841 family protein [Gammaproteobacteria bacterium]